MKKTLLLLSLLALSGAATAATPDLGPGTLDMIVETFRDAAAKWEPIFQKHTLWLFWTLVAIEFTWGAIKQAMNISNFDGWAAFLFNQIMMIGLFNAFILYGSTWATYLVDSFRMAAAQASSVTSISPSGVLDTGLDIAIKLAKADSGSGLSAIPMAIFQLMMAAFIFIIFCFIVAELIFVLVTMWIAVYAGVFLLGFGGLSFTRFLAENYWKTILGLAMKLFMIQLLIGIASLMLEKWALELNTMKEASFQLVFVIAGVVLILHTLITKIGGIADSFVSGAGAASTNGGNMVGTAAAASVGGAAAAVGGGQAVAAAAQSASAKTGGMSAAAGMAKGTLASGLGAAGGQVAKMGGQMLKDLAKAYGEEAVKGLTGGYGGNKGSLSSRVASNLKGKAAERGAANDLAGAQSGGGDKGGSSSGAGNYVSGVES